MKKILFIISILLILVLLGTSCNMDSEINESLPSIPSQILPSPIDNLQKILKIYGTDISEGTEQDTFEALVEKEFNIKIKVFNEKFDFKAGSSLSELEGLFVYYGSTLDSIGYRENNFYPLNEFLENNETFNLLPKTLKDSLKDENGKIWYLPLGHRFTLYRRTYMDEIMIDNNFAIPSTLGELVNLLVSVKNQYGNKDDFSVMYLNSQYCLRELKDILEFYGVIANNINSNYSSIIGWNERNNRFEDSSVNSDLEEVLVTIKYLVELKIIDTDKTVDVPIESNWKAREAGKLFTNFNSTISIANYSSGSLLDENIEYIYNTYLNNFYVPLGVQNPDYAVDTFVNTFLSSNKGNIIGRYGESGPFVEYDNTYTFVHNLPDDKMTLNPENNMVYWIRLVGRWFGNNYAIYNPSVTNEENEAAHNRLLEFYAYTRTGFEEGKIVVLSPSKQINLMSGTQSIKQANSLFSNMLYSYINGNIDSASFIEEYYATMKKLGIERYLNNQNNRIPGAALFSYD